MAGNENDGLRAAGAALVLSAAATMLGMSHHPTTADAAVMGRAVHGALIAVTAVTATGLLLWARSRDVGRPLVAGGLVAYGFALVGHIGAALIDGFAVTALAAGDEPIGDDVVDLAWQLNQALAGLGVVGTGAAFALWGADLLRTAATSGQRLLGAGGLILGLVPAGLLIAGVLRMNLTGATIIYAAQMIWIAWLGLTLLARRAPQPA